MSLIQRLQSVQNAGARLVTGTRQSLIISQQFSVSCTGYYADRQRIHFNTAGCVFQALTGQAPAYLADDCRLISDSYRRRLHSSDIRTWLRGTVVERRSLTGELSLSCARPAADR